MNKYLKIIPAIAFAFSSYTASSQEIAPGQISSVILNSFQQSFPKTYDVEWEMDNGLYKVEFESGFWGPDHYAWYDQTGNLIRHHEEISKNDLPKTILAKISNEFQGFRTDDIKKITEKTKITYRIELETFTQEWEVLFDSDGNILSKIAD